VAPPAAPPTSPAGLSLSEYAARELPDLDLLFRRIFSTALLRAPRSAPPPLPPGQLSPRHARRAARRSPESPRHALPPLPPLPPAHAAAAALPSPGVSSVTTVGSCVDGDDGFSSAPTLTLQAAAQMQVHLSNIAGATNTTFPPYAASPPPSHPLPPSPHSHNTSLMSSFHSPSCSHTCHQHHAYHTHHHHHHHRTPRQPRNQLAHASPSVSAGVADLSSHVAGRRHPLSTPPLSPLSPHSSPLWAASSSPPSRKQRLAALALPANVAERAERLARSGGTRMDARSARAVMSGAAAAGRRARTRSSTPPPAAAAGAWAQFDADTECQSLLLDGICRLSVGLVGQWW
jgi:hypothetical protein